MSDLLHQLLVLVTRPQAQAQSLCDLIQEKGGQACLFPTLEIVPIEDLSHISNTLKEADKYSYSIFVTANAVNIIAPHWPTTAKTQNIAMGEATAKSMREAGIEVSAMPEQNFSSEGLLSIPLLNDVKGKRILLFTGEGGRRLLVDELSEKGALVEEVTVYRRCRPDVSPAQVASFWESKERKIMVSTSVASLENLLHLAGPRIFQIPLLVVSERMKKAAYELGDFVEIIVTKQVSDQSILDALIAWYPTSIG